MDVKTIQLWGDTNVGKTMLLSAAFGDLAGIQHDFPQIDFSHEETRLDSFVSQFRQMKLGRPVQATFDPWNHGDLRLDLIGKQQERIAIRDIRGGSWLEFDGAQNRALGEATQALLFLLAWDPHSIKAQIQAIHGLLPHIEGVRQAGRVGLVFTQCDRALPMRLHHYGWAQAINSNSLLSHSEVVRQLRDYSSDFQRRHGHDFFTYHFGERIWFTSSWGYADADERWAAAVLTDFGECLPCHIRPVNVRAPFQAIIETLLSSEK